MSRTFIVDGVRTPIGRYGGALSGVRPDDLAAHVIGRLVERQPGVDWETADDVVFGCANQAGEDNRDVARMAVLPETVPATTVNRLCGSGADAVAIAARAIQADQADVVIAGGVESVSRAPFVISKAQTAFARGVELHDTTLGWRFVNPALEAAYGTDSMGETAENVAAEHVNPNGGAIALGHPLGMSGARLCLTAALELRRRDARRAVVTLCIGVGQGIAVLLERPK